MGLAVNNATLPERKRPGRKPGVPNLVTAEMRELLKQFTVEKFPAFVKAFDALEYTDKTKIYVSLLPYVAPKLQAILIEDNSKEKGTVVDDMLKAKGLLIEFTGGSSDVIPESDSEDLE